MWTISCFSERILYSKGYVYVIYLMNPYIKYRKILIIGKGTVIKYKTLLELHLKIADFADP